MERKDIEKGLKKEAERFTPDPLDQIKTAARAENLLPYDSEQTTETYRQGSAAVLAKNKRKSIWLLSAIASFIVCFVLILSLMLSFGGKKPFPPASISLSVQDVYGMGAVSSVRLLGTNIPVSAVKSLSAVSYADTDASEDEVKRQAQRFNEYFTALDSFLGDDIVSTTTEINSDVQYPYQVKMTITGKDLAGNTIPYVMYYTETLEGSEEDEEEEDEEKESEYRLIGVMVIDGADYYLEGARTEESEKDESETELKIRAYADKEDKNNYIQMEQEYSVEEGETETEYVYSVYVNGELLEQTAVEFEREKKNNKVETEYELEFRNGASKGKYLVEREEKDNKSEIKVKYEIDGKTGVFHIREITDESGNKKYEYSYSDGSKEVFE